MANLPRPNEYPLALLEYYRGLYMNQFKESSLIWIEDSYIIVAIQWASLQCVYHEDAYVLRSMRACYNRRRGASKGAAWKRLNKGGFNA